MFNRVILLSFLFSTYVLADLPNSYNTHIGLIDPLSMDHVSSKNNSHVLPKNTAGACTATEFGALTVQETVNELATHDKTCFTFLFNVAGASERYTDTKFIAVADAAVTNAASYDGSQDFSNFFMYLRSTSYIRQLAPSSVPPSTTTTLDALRAAINAFESTPAFVTRVSANHDRLQYQWLYTLESLPIADLMDHYVTLKQFNGAVTADIAIVRQFSIFASQSIFFRGVVSDGPFKIAVSQDLDWINIFETISTDLGIINEPSVSFISNNATLEIGRMLSYYSPTTMGEVVNSVQRLLDFNTRLNSRWLALVTAIFNSGTDCTQFTGGNVCKNATLIAEVENAAFPNTFTFDNGQMVFHTPLPRADVEQLYYQLKETQATFFKVTGATTPVAGDPNDVAIFRIYRSRNDYVQYQGFLYGIGTNNGGIYIERDSTLFTYDRESWESSFTLEELSRHEYTHYLTSRYLVPGMWCFGSCVTNGGPLDDGALYADQRLTWFDEGFANFIAGGTQSSGINPLNSMIGWIANRTTHYTPTESVSVLYGDPFMYPYAEMIFNYLYTNKSDALKRIFNIIRSNDIAGYDALRAELAAIDPTSYNDFILSQIANAATVIDPWKLYPNETQLPLTTANDVQLSIETNFAGLFSSLACVDLTDIQFGCDATINYTILNPNVPLYEVHDAIDNIVTTLITSPQPNLQTMNCYQTVVTDTVQTIRCEGGLRSPTTSFNSAPTAIDGNASVVAEQTITGQMTGTDPENDALTYTVTTAPTSGALSWSSDGSFTYTASYIEAPVTIQFVANDGEYNSANTGTITINVLPNATPTANDVNLTTTDGQLITGTMSGTDPENDVLTYFFVGDPQNGNILFDSNTGAFEYAPTPGFVGTELMHYYVSDGRTNSAQATITVVVDNGTVVTNNAPTVTNSSISLVENTSLTGQMLGSDPDGDSITFTATNPSHGSLTWNTDGSYTYAPSTNYVGSDSFTFTVNDGQVDSLSGTISITVTDDPANNSTGTTPPTSSAPVASGGGSMGIWFAGLMLVVISRRRLLARD